MFLFSPLTKKIQKLNAVFDDIAKRIFKQTFALENLFLIIIVLLKNEFRNLKKKTRNE